MTTKHPLAEILYAIADGKEVQQRILSCGNREWKKLDYHSAFSLGLPNVEYRIKPKEKVKKWRWVYHDKDLDKWEVTEEFFMDSNEFYETYNSKYCEVIEKVSATEQEFDE